MTDDDGEDQQPEDDGPGTFDNPAARIRYWLQQGQPLSTTAYGEFEQRRHNGTSGPRTVPERMLEFWGRIWGVSPSTTAGRIEWHRRALGLVDAGYECRRLAEASNHWGASTALANFEQVEATLDHFMGDPNLFAWDMFNGIDTAGWTSLDHLDNFLTNTAKQPELTGGQTQQILNQARSLADLIRESDLDEQDKLILLDKVAEVEAAVARARVAGTADVLRAADGLMGGVIRLGLRGVDLMRNPVAVAVFALIGVIFKLMGVVADFTAIEQSPLGEMLGLPSPHNGDGPTP